ncbi:MAG: hypothetical protein ACXQTP_00675 [Candidatus Methanofastidiosia archaeon]
MASSLSLLTFSEVGGCVENKDITDFIAKGFTMKRLAVARFPFLMELFLKHFQALLNPKAPFAISRKPVKILIGQQFS